MKFCSKKRRCQRNRKMIIKTQPEIETETEPENQEYSTFEKPLQFRLLNVTRSVGTKAKRQMPAQRNGTELRQMEKS